MENVAMVWLQEGLWYGPQTWIIERLKMYKIFIKIINFMKAMKSWKVEPTAGGKTSAEVKTQRYLPKRLAFTLLMSLYEEIRRVTSSYIDDVYVNENAASSRRVK